MTGNCRHVALNRATLIERQIHEQTARLNRKTRNNVRCEMQTHGQQSRIPPRPQMLGERWLGSNAETSTSNSVELPFNGHCWVSIASHLSLPSHRSSCLSCRQDTVQIGFTTGN